MKLNNSNMLDALNSRPSWRNRAILLLSDLLKHNLFPPSIVLSDADLHDINWISAYLDTSRSIPSGGDLDKIIISIVTRNEIVSLLVDVARKFAQQGPNTAPQTNKS